MHIYLDKAAKCDLKRQSLFEEVDPTRTIRRRRSV